MLRDDFASYCDQDIVFYRDLLQCGDINPKDPEGFECYREMEAIVGAELAGGGDDGRSTGHLA